MRTLQQWYRYLDQQARLVAQLHQTDHAPSASPPPVAPTGPAAASRERRTTIPVTAGVPAAQATVPPRGHTRPAPPRSPGRPPATRDRQEVVRRLLDPEVTLHDAAVLLSLSKSTLRRYTAAGRLPSFRTPGGQRRFRLSDLLTFMEQTGRMG